MDLFLKSILDPSEVNNYPNIAEFLLAKKNRSSLLAGVRNSITHNYSFKGTKGGKTAFVSPNYFQWFEDGVMFLERKEQFIGLIALYRNGRLSYAVAARDVGHGETMGPEDFEFIGIDDVLNQLKQIPL